MADFHSGTQLCDMVLVWIGTRILLIKHTKPLFFFYFNGKSKRDGDIKGKTQAFMLIDCGKVDFLLSFLALRRFYQINFVFARIQCIFNRKLNS